jgi:hypothetical protein
VPDVKRLTRPLIGLLVAVCLLAGCGTSSPAPDALGGGFTADGTFGVATLRPGGEIAALFADLTNVSHETVVLRSVASEGPGMGSVLTVTARMIGPTGLEATRCQAATAPIPPPGPRAVAAGSRSYYPLTAIASARARPHDRYSS